jgi:DNA ligase (NAD+)
MSLTAYSNENVEYVDNIENKKDTIINMKNWGVKSYDNLFNSLGILYSGVSESTILSALAIENIGKTNSEAFCKEYSLIDIIEEKLTLTEEKLVKIEGFSKKRSKFLLDGLEKNKEILKTFLSRNIIKREKVIEINSETPKFNFVITGEVPGYTRDGIEVYLKELGHKMSSSVSKKTNYVVCNDPNSGTKKIKDALKNDVPVITSKELLELINPIPQSIDKNILDLV